MTLEQFIQEKILTPRRWRVWAGAQRRAGLTIATVNGCFDLLHPGHMHHLYEAHSRADRLLVALNTDQYIQRSKGSHRPIYSLADRLTMMASVEFVSAVTWFGGTTCLRFLRAVRPDVHVNGAEYGRNCVEARALSEIGARLHLVDRVGGYATRKLVAKLRSASARSSCSRPDSNRHGS